MDTHFSTEHRVYLNMGIKWHFKTIKTFDTISAFILGNTKIWFAIFLFQYLISINFNFNLFHEVDINNVKFSIQFINKNAIYNNLAIFFVLDAAVSSFKVKFLNERKEIYNLNSSVVFLSFMGLTIAEALCASFVKNYLLNQSQTVYLYCVRSVHWLYM